MEKQDLMQQYQSLFEAVNGYSLLGNISNMTCEELQEEINKLNDLLR